MTFAAIVVAAGRGTRFGRPKQFVDVAGRPLVAWSLGVFAKLPEIRDLVVATEAEHLAAMTRVAAEYAPRLRTTVIVGGATRRASVRRALAAVPSTCDAAFVHDGARPLVLEADVRAGMAATARGRGALLAVPVVDTIKVVRDAPRVAATLDRSELWAAQTPQFGMLADLIAAHDAPGDDREATDDAMLLERIGCEVVVIRTSSDNFKVTLGGDRDLAEAILLERERRSATGAAGARA